MTIANPPKLDPRPAYRPWVALSRAPLSFRLGGAILIIHVLVATLGPFLAPYGYAQMGAGIPLSGMSWAHPFGIDQLGRDIFSRVIDGGHIVIMLSLSGTALGLILGRSWAFSPALISIPFLVLALMAIAAAGPEAAGDPVLIILVIALVYAPRIAHMARSVAIDIATRDFVTVARLRGESAWSVMRRELLPNATSVLLVEFALRAGYAPVLIGSLGFLGFGMRPPTPEWGLMISENRALPLEPANPDRPASKGMPR